MVKLERQGDREVWTADSLGEVEAAGWQVLMYEDWKRGVARVRCTRTTSSGGEMRTVYVKSSTCTGTGALVV